MNVPRVVIVNTHLYPLFSPNIAREGGGTEIQLYFIAKGLSTLFDVQAVTGDWGQQRIISKEGITFFRSFSLQKKLKNYLKAPFQFLRALWFSRGDVYIVSPVGLEFFIVCLYCFLFGKKVIFRTAHDAECDGTYEKEHVILGAFFNFCLRRVNAVVAQTKLQQGLLKSKKFVESTLIRNGFSAQADDDIQKVGVLWVSRLVPWKRPEILIELAKINPDIPFTMIGPGTDAYAKAIRQKAKEIKNIHCIENVPFVEIQKYFNKALIFVGTSEKEGFPNTYIQASLGRVAILSYLVDPDSFLTQHKAGVVVNENFDILNESLRKLLNDEGLRLSCIQNAYSYATNKHSLINMQTSWKELVYKVLTPNV